MRGAALPVALIVFGVAGLAWYYELFPDIDTLIALGLACGGAGHERRGVSVFALVPAMLIVIGVLMLVARSPQVPERSRRKEAGARKPAEPV